MANVVALGGTEAMMVGDAWRLSVWAACDANMLPTAAHETAMTNAAEARAGFLNAGVLFTEKCVLLRQGEQREYALETGDAAA